MLTLQGVSTLKQFSYLTIMMNSLTNFYFPPTNPLFSLFLLVSKISLFCEMSFLKFHTHMDHVFLRLIDFIEQIFLLDFILLSNEIILHFDYRQVCFEQFRWFHNTSSIHPRDRLLKKEENYRLAFTVMKSAAEQDEFDYFQFSNSFMQKVPRIPVKNSHFWTSSLEN